MRMMQCKCQATPTLPMAFTQCRTEVFLWKTDSLQSFQSCAIALYGIPLTRHWRQATNRDHNPWDDTTGCPTHQEGKDKPINCQQEIYRYADGPL